MHCWWRWLSRFFVFFCPWWPYLWLWHSKSSERETNHVFPLNLAQIRSAVQEIYEWQTKWQTNKKVTDSDKTEPYLCAVTTSITKQNMHCAPFLQCLGQLSLHPPWTVKWVSGFRLSNNNKWQWWMWMWMVAAIYTGRLTVQVGWLGLGVGSHPGAQSAFIKRTRWTLKMALVMMTAP